MRSRRSAYEKSPWSGLPDLDGTVESEFVRPFFVGETVLPFRVRAPLRAVIPWDGADLLDGGGDRIELYPGLAEWYRQAEGLWLANRSSSRLTLNEQLDFHGKLRAQFPIQPQRVVYTSSGMHLSAARVLDRRGIVGHGLYWSFVTSDEEARYLCAILNAAVLTRLVRPLMSYGKDERHFDKYVWQLAIPVFDDTLAVHRRLASLAEEVEAEIAALPVDDSLHFSALRRRVRRHLETSVAGRQIEEIVAGILEPQATRT